jgi:hypothetical protein
MDKELFIRAIDSFVPRFTKITIAGSGQELSRACILAEHFVFFGGVNAEIYVSDCLNQIHPLRLSIVFGKMKELSRKE